MIEIRIHGRGGQGAVVASLIMARAGFHKGLHVQAFPQFGVERRGAPVLAFARLSEEPIRVRSAVYRPHHIMVLDAALMEHTDVTQGLRPEGWIVINSPQPPQSFPLNENWNLATVNATTIAATNGIGSVTQPIVNTTMIGALVRVTKIVELEDLEWALAETFKKRVQDNQKATREAYEKVSIRAATGDRVTSVSR